MFELFSFEFGVLFDNKFCLFFSLKKRLFVAFEEMIKFLLSSFIETCFFFVVFSFNSMSLSVLIFIFFKLLFLRIGIAGTKFFLSLVSSSIKFCLDFLLLLISIIFSTCFKLSFSLLTISFLLSLSSIKSSSPKLFSII